MNMKKVLAVVMAVMLAISAMAVTAFAADYEITLSSAGSKSNGAAYSTVEFTIPVWAQYGYAVAGDTIKLSLPNTYTANVDDVDYTVNASYVVVANGVSYALGLNADGVYEIVFGTLAHSWNPNDLNTVIPQSTVVGDNAALTVIGTWSIAKKANGSEAVRVSAKDFQLLNTYDLIGWSSNKFTSFLGWVQDEAGNWVRGDITISYDVKAISNDNPNSVSYCWDWNPVDGADIAANDSTWNAGLTELKWDATLTNKAMVIGAETAKVVVKLDRTIVGNYYFGLTATYANGLNYELGNNFNNYNPDVNWGKYAAYVEIEEPTDTITFEIPKAVLYSTNYGVFNESIDIECIDLFHKTVLDTINGQTIASGTLGDYSWTTVNGEKVISFCGQEVNVYWNQWSNAKPVSVTLVLGYTDVEDTAEDIVVEDPVESTEEESEEITVTEPVVEDTNPGTGIALAVVPMVLAAAAVVASKRR